MAMTRRHWLAGMAGGLASILPAVGLARLLATPPGPAGPFYPTELPLDDDNDLTRVAGREGVAKGEITDLTGRLLDTNGDAIPGARIEIWQCDAFGRYHHPRDRGGRADPNFQGYGQTATDAEGAYRFRTIKPVPYPGRTPHVHFAISGPGIDRLTTQMYLAGEPLNQRDGLFNRVRDPGARARLLVELAPAPNLEAAALAGRFDIVLDDRLLGG